MRNLNDTLSRRLWFCALSLTLSALPPVSARVLDDFNDNTRTAWTDFDFPIGVPYSQIVEQNGQLKFTLAAVGQSIFSASTKTSETLTVQDGRTVELRVDLVSGNGGDAFAVVVWIPSGLSPGTLSGYGFAKSSADILVTKGINKYFVDEATALKNENVTLVMSLTGKGTSVVLNCKILDKDNKDAVLWEKTVVDTDGEDVMAGGKDDPKAPYMGSGNYTLYCYEDNGKTQESYEVTFDNAEVYVTDTVILDDFNDNTKTAWTDFNFPIGVPYGQIVEQNGQLQFVLAAVGQSIFSASTKTSRTFDVVDGERIELRVDMVSGNGVDAFGVLVWAPTGSSPSTLSGYGFAKASSDILVTKGINKYFVADDTVAAEIKNENVTLAMSLTGKGTSVIINCKVLDKDNHDAVLWEKTVVDTADEDVLADGKDDPKAAYIGSGNYTLYCYEDNGKTQASYEVVFDNAVVAAPPVVGNTAPIISDVQPDNGANFLPTGTQISFKVTDDKPLVNETLSVVLNGTNYTATNGLVVNGTGNTRNVSFSGLPANANIVARLLATDADNVTVTNTLYLDTFAASDRAIEIEDYNFASGQFIDNPVLISEGTGPVPNSYNNQTGTSEVDFMDTQAAPNNTDTLYRTFDPVRMQHSLDKERAKFTAAGGQASLVYDYDVGDIARGEWLNYTRTFAAGSYEVYLREALANVAQAECVLEQVTGSATDTNQTTKPLGSFLGSKSGFEFRNVPLTDGSGQNKAVLRLSGTVTLRLRQVTADPDDGAIYQNYLVFLPVADTGVQRATISALSPAAGSTVETVTPTIEVAIQNRDTTVNTSTIKLQVNGHDVTPTIQTNANGATVTYPISPLPAPGANNTASVSFKDNENFDIASEWSFVVSYKALNPANRLLGPGLARGFKVRMVQAPLGSALEDSLDRAENQLALSANLPAPVLDTNAVEQVINMAQDDRVSGNFPGETLVPGIDDAANGTDDFTVEVQTWLELPAGALRFGVVTDDGFKISSGSSPSDKEPVLAFRNGGTANLTFDLVVPEAGFYPFRMIWYERAGNAYAEWFTVDMTDPEKRTLLNDPQSPQAIKAYLEVAAPPPVQLESASGVTGPYSLESTAAVNTSAKTVTIAQLGAARFYRLRATTALQITSVKLVGNNVVMTYQ